MKHLSNTLTLDNSSESGNKIGMTTIQNMVYMGAESLETTLPEFSTFCKIVYLIWDTLLVHLSLIENFVTLVKTEDGPPC